MASGHHTTGAQDETVLNKFDLRVGRRLHSDGRCVCQQAQENLAYLDDALALKAVGYGTSKQGQYEEREGVGSADDAEKGGIAIGQLIYEIGAGEHLHLHGAHPRQHSEPEEAKVAVLQ